MFKGFSRGLQLIATALHNLFYALRVGNFEMRDDYLELLRVWLSELADEQGVVRGSTVRALASQILFGDNDPFAGSRVKLRELLAKYGSH